MEKQAILKVKGLSKAYTNHKALDNIDLTVHKGDIFGLLGQNGAGKTTLIRILTQIYTADSGQIELFGNRLSASHLNKIGYLPEERGLYKKMFVDEHLYYLGQLRNLSKNSIKSSIDEWLEKFNLQEKRKALVGTLSKGNQQKVQFIATLMHQPEFIILDEPFSGFDPVNAEILKKEILNQQKLGNTILYSTHRMESVEELCSNIAFIHQSKCIYHGNVDALKNNHRKNTLDIEIEGKKNSSIDFPSSKSEKGNIAYHIDLAKHNRQKAIETVNNYHSIIALNEHALSLHEIFLKLVQ